MRALLIALAAVMAATLPARAETETPDYELVFERDPFEIRQYGSMIVAETLVEGERSEAANDAFRILAAYIFGENIASEEIAMTAPVTQTSESRKIAMTAPVTQTGDAQEGWRVQFIMPAEYTMETLPKPTDARIQIVQVPPRRFAAIRFSGFAWARKLEKKTASLEGFVSEQGLEPASEPTFAFYDPPWTPPFLRRNEVLIEIVAE
ncbi:MAG: heme-binding protein [Pseudomonadota bacterium]